MQFTSEVLQNKPPSLEEGPMKFVAHNESCGFYRVEKRSIFQKCTEIMKLILLLEVIFFVGWLGRILISNYHLEYNKDITAHEPFFNNLHGDDFPVTPNSISNDDLVIRDVNVISSTEHSQIPTIPELAAAFPSTEESYGGWEWTWLKKDPEVFDEEIEWPFKIYYEKNFLSNPPLDNADTDLLEEISNTKKVEFDPIKVKITNDLEDSSVLLSNFGLIHVIEDRVYDSNVDSNSESKIPFPLFENFSGTKAADKVKNKLENEISENSNTSETNNTSKSSNTSENSNTSETNNTSEKNDPTESSIKSDVDSQVKSIFDLN